MDELIPDGKTRLLLVEGDDDQVFFDRFVNHLADSTDAQLQVEDLAVIQYEGRDKLTQRLRDLKRADNLEHITHLGIVRDSDFNTDALRSVQDRIKTVNREGPPNIDIPDRPIVQTFGDLKVSVLIVPSVGREGSLETILLEALAEDSMMRCVDKYIDCVKETHPTSEVARNREDKSRLSVLLAGKLIMRDLARSKDATRELPRYMYSMKWWDDDTFDRPAFEDAKAFLRQLLAD